MHYELPVNLLRSAAVLTMASVTVLALTLTKQVKVCAPYSSALEAAPAAARVNAPCSTELGDMRCGLPSTHGPDTI